MNKITNILLIFVLLFAVACGGESNTTENTDTDTDVTSNSETTENDNTEITNEVDKFVSEAGNFKIKFPAEPTKSTEKVSTAVGDINMYSFLYEERGVAAYMVAFSDYPESAIKSQDAKTMLDNAKSGFVGKLKLSITKEEAIKLGEYEGVMFKANSDQYYVYVKDYLVKNRLYQVAILRADGYPTDSDVKSFVDSFELISK